MRGAAAVLASVLLFTAAGRSEAATCAGDCDGNDEVVINELVTLVNVALGGAPVSGCSAGDVNQSGEISIDEIVVAVFKALEGCAAEPTPAPCTADSCRPCTAADTLCYTGHAGGDYCCTLSGSGFTVLDGPSGCQSSGIYNPTPNAGANGCWTAPDGPCHSEYICLVVNSPTPTDTRTPTVTVTPTVTATPSATQTANATATATATPTVQPCDGSQTTACQAQCSLTGCCFNPTPTGVPGSPTPVIACFDPSVTTPGADNWYGSTVCGGQGFYTGACQVGTPATTGTATPTGIPTGTATATVTFTSMAAASPTATDTPQTNGPTATATGTATPAGATATATPSPTGSPSSHVVTVINKCSFPVWVGAVGSVPAVETQNCSSGSCPAGQQCNTSQSTAICVWGMPAADTGSFALGAAGSGSDQAVFDVPPAQAVGGSNQVLNVNLYGQTGCTSLPTVCCADATLASCGTQTGCTLGGSDCTQDPRFTTCVDPCVFGPCGTNCESAPCNSPSRSAPCAIGSGPVGPHTQAELNLFMSIVDSYDVSYINGLNVPMEVRAVNGPLDSMNPYFCGNPGGTDSLSGLGGCTYSINTTVTINNVATDYAPYLRNVLPGGAACTPTAADPDPACPNAGDVCGLTMSTDFTTLTTTCGTQAGWWTADEVCTQFPNYSGGPFDCQASTGQDTYGSLYQCAGANVTDCYNPSSTAMCCGCPVWPDATLPPCANLGSNCCYHSNPTWVTYAQPWANVFKTACPTAYSFPNDDVTSSFSCPITVSPTQTNTTAYEVVYCPGGLTGQ